MSALSESERHEQILRRLESENEVVVKALAEAFQVSEVTIRKDLEHLRERRLLRRTRGGAIPYEGADEGEFDMRLRNQVGPKEAIAAAAAELVDDGDAIALDCSTTCYQLALALRGRRRLVVVTNGLRAAELLSEEESFTVILVGGTIRRASWSLVGRLGMAIPKDRLRRGFFGATALAPEDGLMELSLEEAAAKRRLVDASREVFGLVDASKIGRFGLHTFAPTADLTGVLTDDRADLEFEQAWRDANVEVARVAGRPPEDSQSKAAPR